LRSRGEVCVDAPIGLELAALVAHQVDPEMQDRPQAVVAEPVVEAVEVVLREVERRERDAIGLLGPQARLAGRRHAPAPAEPEAAALVERVHEPHGEPARCRGAADRAHAIGDRDQASGALHVKPSHPRESRMAAFTMPTSE
jgi:hypothetical protein